MSCGISSSFPEVFPTSGQVTHVLLTRPPLDWKELPPSASLDLHVLITPPEFIMSHDQTLHLNPFQRPRTEIRGRLKKNLDLLYESKQKLCLLREKTEKTSGTLYSVFKEPDPGFHRGRAVPPAQVD